MDPATIFFLLRLLIALMLYGFIALLFLFLRRDLTTSNRGEEQLPIAHLITLDGDGLEANYSLEELNLIGRADDNTLPLPVGTVSAYHARLSCQRGTWWIEDLGSRNGTLLNEITVTEPLIVGFGDEIQLGSIRFRFLAGPAPQLDKNSTSINEDKDHNELRE
jgi:pSer/pThr/pTyr-binding forkhead associated (FHA) protein